MTASCSDGEQLLGGGFTFEEPRYPFDSRGNQIADRDGNVGGHVITVTGSYPATDKKSWTVDFINPDPGLAGPNMGVFLTVNAYCLPTTVLDLGMESQTNEEPAPVNNAVGRLIIRAPRGSVVTDGGYRMDYQQDDPRPDYNGYVKASAPLLDGDSTVGWQVGKMPSFSNHAAKMNAYVLFATKNVSAGKTQRVLGTTDGNGWGSYAATPQCADDEFSVGGGFELVNSPDFTSYIPSHVNENVAFPDASGWRSHGIDGYDNHPTPSTTSSYTSAVCLKSPQPTICVKIRTPADGTRVELESADPASKTQVIIFSAEAFKGKTQLQPSAISWMVNGQTLGTGSPATFALPVPYPVPGNISYFQVFHVTARATDGVTTASASVTVYVQRIVVL